MEDGLADASASPVRPPAAARRALAPDCAAPTLVSATDEMPDASPSTRSVSSPNRGWRWADLMRRVFELDVLACPRCDGRLRLIAVLEASDTTARILRHLHLPTEVPRPRRPVRRPTWTTGRRLTGGGWLPPSTGGYPGSPSDVCTTVRRGGDLAPRRDGTPCETVLICAVQGGGKGMTAGERGPTSHNRPSVNFDPR